MAQNRKRKAKEIEKNISDNGIILDEEESKGLKEVCDGRPWICPANRQEWRQWLQDNHDKSNGVWMVLHNKSKNKKNNTKKKKKRKKEEEDVDEEEEEEEEKKDIQQTSLTYEEAVEECLCFGWIDGKVKSLSATKRVQLLTPRKSKSTWSAVNKKRIEMLIEAGLMTKAGLAKIEEAKQNGSWTSLDSVEALEVPQDLQKKLKEHPKALKNFENFSKSAKKGFLYWLNSAKREETRAKRIQEIVAMAGKNITRQQTAWSKYKE